MVKSKLDYLSKYTEKPVAKKAKKEKKKKKKISDWSDERLNDEDEALLPPPPPEDDDDEQDDDERPIVVPSGEIIEGSIGSSKNTSREPPRGTWNTVDDVDARRGGVRERHDSSDDNDVSDVRPSRPREQQQPSTSGRRPRHDSSDEDDDSNRRKRHDSASEDERPQRPARRRHDSYESEDGSEKEGKSRSVKQNTDSGDEVADSANLRKKRHDSSDDDSLDNQQPTHEVGSGRSRKRHDSSDDDSENKKVAPRKKARHDSSDEESKSADDIHSKRQTESNEQSRGEKSSSAEGGGRRQLMSSGHMGGLQHGREFSEAEKKIQAKRRAEALAMVDKYGVGETVYRDAEGRKVDAEELKKKKETPKISEEEQRQLNRGRVQKEQDEARKREMEELQQSSFARHVDDAALDAMQKNIIREGDPMAQSVVAKREKPQAVPGQQNARPVYKGPAPKPNRFGIRPGYRWDGVERGNGFEDKLLASQFSAQIRREEAYKWSTADM